MVPEAKAYDDFLAQHWLCGGWHPDDAATFAQAFKCAAMHPEIVTEPAGSSSC